MMKKVSNYIQYVLALCTIKFLSVLPAKFMKSLAAPVARILFLMPQLGKVAMMNLEVVFPDKTEKERKEIALGSLRNLYLSLCEFFLLRGHSEKVLAMNNVDNSRPTAEAAKATGKSAVFFTPHIGNWELSGMTLALTLGFKLGTVVRSARNPWLDKLVSDGRMVEGVTIIHSHGAARAMYSALKKGMSLGVLIDQNTRARDGGDFVDFFGLKVPVSMLPAHLARKENLFVAVGASFRLKDGSFTSFLAPLPKKTCEYASDVELTQDVMRLTEKMILEHPDQYLWMYKRFQYIPREASEDLAKKYPPYATRAQEKFYTRRPAAMMKKS